MIKHTRALQDTLVADAYDAEDELDMITHRQYQLSQKDHWENNSVLDDILNLLPRLIDFGRRRETVSVIVTSIFNPPDEVEELPMYTSYIDTVHIVYWYQKEARIEGWNRVHTSNKE